MTMEAESWMWYIRQEESGNEDATRNDTGKEQTAQAGGGTWVAAGPRRAQTQILGGEL
jgi:hypothetical protein